MRPFGYFVRWAGEPTDISDYISHVADDASTSRVPADAIRQHVEGAGPGRVRVGLLWGARVLSVIVAIALLVAIGYYSQTLRNLNNNAQKLPFEVGVAPNHPAPPAAPGQSQPNSSNQVPQDVDGKDQNILVVGNDDRSNMTNEEVRALHVGRGGGLNTDTMMIVHVPADGSSATLISLPRDSYVNIPGYGMNRLNAAYSLGYMNASGSTDDKRLKGANLLIKTVTNLTGLFIDHFVQVSLIGFYRIAKAIGGVTVNLCNAIDGRPYMPLVLSAGKHTLTPAQALDFVRQRHGLSSDLAREARQRYFITAAFRQITSAGVLLNPGKLSALVSAVDKSIWVDTGFNLLKFASQMDKLSANNIVGNAIPYVAPINVSVGSVLQIDPNEVRRFVANLIDGADAAVKNATTLPPSHVTVSVRGSQGVPGAAAKSTAALTSAGFHATKTAAIDAKQVKTSIEYGPGMEAEAKTLSRYVKHAAIDQVPGLTTLTLVLGSDGTVASSHPTHRVRHTRPLDKGCIQ